MLSCPTFVIRILKVAVVAGAIGWLSKTVSFQAIPALLSQIDASWLLAGLAAFTLTPVFQAIRLRSMLAARGIVIPRVESMRLALAGNLLNYAAPLGSTAGDVFKALRIARRTGAGVEGATTVLVDRVVGLVTLLISVTAIAWFVPANHPMSSLRLYLLVFAALASVMGAGLLLVSTSRLPRGVAVRLQTLRAGPVGRAVRTVRALLASPAVLLRAVAATFIIQLAAAAAFWCVAKAIGFSVVAGDGLSIYAGFSTGEIIKALPGPPQGLGSMELAYATLFQPFARPEQIIASALLIRLVGLFCALPGVIVLWTTGADAASNPGVEAGPISLSGGLALRSV